MKSKLLQRLKLKLTPANRDRLKRALIEKTQHCGLAATGFVLRALIRVLYGKKSWRTFGSTSTVTWHIPSFIFYISPDRIAGIDEALKENLWPGEAVDKLAREFGIPEHVIKATSHQNKKQLVRFWVNKN